MIGCIYSSDCCVLGKLAHHLQWVRVEMDKGAGCTHT